MLVEVNAWTLFLAKFHHRDIYNGIALTFHEIVQEFSIKHWIEIATYMIISLKCDILLSVLLFYISF